LSNKYSSKKKLSKRLSTERRTSLLTIVEGITKYTLKAMRGTVQTKKTITYTNTARRIVWSFGMVVLIVMAGITETLFTWQCLEAYLLLKNVPIPMIYVPRVLVSGLISVERKLFQNLFSLNLEKFLNIRFFDLFIWWMSLLLVISPKFCFDWNDLHKKNWSINAFRCVYSVFQFYMGGKATFN
jgi:hypothetical protein